MILTVFKIKCDRKKKKNVITNTNHSTYSDVKIKRKLLDEHSRKRGSYNLYFSKNNGNHISIYISNSVFTIYLFSPPCQL